MAKNPLNESHFGLTYIATGDQTGGRYFQCSSAIPAGDSGPPTHTHANESEGFYVVSGSLCLIVKGLKYVLHKGDFLNVLPGEAHTWLNDSEETVELIITFSPSGIEHMFRELDDSDADFASVGEKYGMKIVG